MYYLIFENGEKTMSFVIKDDNVLDKHDEIKINFLSDEVLKENEHYTCIGCITIDSVMRMEKKNYPQVYLEE